MGEVYRALDTRLHRTVAIKILPARLSSDADLRARFAQEAQAVSALHHPNMPMRALGYAKPASLFTALLLTPWSKFSRVDKTS
jgi:serine/threonine protein kinase